MKTLGEIITAVQRNTRRNDVDMTARIKSAVNEAVREWARLLPWPDLRTVESIAHSGGRNLVLPGHIENISWIFDITNKAAIDASSDQWDRDNTYDYAAGTVGYAKEWEDAGIVPAWTSVSGPLVAQNSGASDTTALYVTGMAQSTAFSGPLGQYHAVEELSMVGSTSYTTTQNFISVESLVKSSDCTGLITITCGGAAVALLGPLDQAAEYRQIRLMNIPAIGTLFTYGAFMKPKKLKDNNQSPHPSIDPDFLAWYATYLIQMQLKEPETAAQSRAQALGISAEQIAKVRGRSDCTSRVTPEDLE